MIRYIARITRLRDRHAAIYTRRAAALALVYIRHIFVYTNSVTKPFT